MNNEFIEDVRAFFEDCPEDAITIAGMQHGFLEGADRVETAEDIREACEELCMEGMIEVVGVDTYACTTAYRDQREQDFREFFDNAVAEHVTKAALKKAAGK